MRTAFDECFGSTTSEPTDNRLIKAIGICLVVFVVLIIILAVILWVRHKAKRESSASTQDSYSALSSTQDSDITSNSKPKVSSTNVEKNTNAKSRKNAIQTRHQKTNSSKTFEKKVSNSPMKLLKK